jgi:hypothetical protein
MNDDVLDMIDSVYGNDQFTKNMLILRAKANKALIYLNGHDGGFYTYAIARSFRQRLKDAWEYIRCKLGCIRKVRIIGHETHYLLMSRNWLSLCKSSELKQSMRDLRRREKEHVAKSTTTTNRAN